MRRIRPGSFKIERDQAWVLELEREREISGRGERGAGWNRESCRERDRAGSQRERQMGNGEVEGDGREGKSERTGRGR